jgi:hypothetical protein
LRARKYEKAADEFETSLRVKHVIGTVPPLQALPPVLCIEFDIALCPPTCTLGLGTSHGEPFTLVLMAHLALLQVIARAGVPRWLTTAWEQPTGT